MEKRHEIIHALNDKFAEMSTETILFHQALADMLGFHMTTAAVTGIIDRLEQAGYARRANDPKDRRRTIVEPIRNNRLERKLETIFTPFHEKMHKLLSSYSDSELAFVLDVMTKTIELTHEESKKLRQSMQRQSYSSIKDRQKKNN
jgi:DNA-binding MarR family transcriptional regulator